METIKKIFYAALTILFVLIIAFFLTACGNNNQPNKLKDGEWRAEFLVQGQEIPFIFRVEGTDTDTTTIYLINATEKVPLKQIEYRNDSVRIYIDSYDTALEGKIMNDRLEGRFRRLYLDNDSGVPFRAVWNNDQRFEIPDNLTSIPVEGRWDIEFIDENNGTTSNVGIFTQDENGIVTGSILTNGGDLRYLEGTLTQNGFQLSSFGGLSPYLIKAVFKGKDSFEGKFYTTRNKIRLIGKRNAEANLADPYSLTTIKAGQEKINFTFPNVDGTMVSLSDPRYQGKVVVISVLGSWCPNCLDEMEFLSPWYKQNRDRGVEIIGLAFERKDDPEYVRRVLGRLIDRYDVEYEILVAGKLGEESTSKALPQFSKISVYPTTIFVDKAGNVRKVHTGFNGPATGLFYDEFKRDFNKLIDDLLEE